MTCRTMLAAACLIAVAGPAMAVDSGGVPLAPGLNGGPVGLARPLLSAMQPLVTAHELQGGMTAADRQAKNQDMITRLRGDPGYLAGFALGTPLAASRQITVGSDWSGDGGGWSPHGHHGHGGRGPRQIVINNQGPLAITNGNGNVVQQQSAQSSGPVAQQQLATSPGAAVGGASNIVTPGGIIVQQAPRGR